MMCFSGRISHPDLQEKRCETGDQLGEARALDTLFSIGQRVNLSHDVLRLFITSSSDLTGLVCRLHALIWSQLYKKNREE